MFQNLLPDAPLNWEAVRNKCWRLVRCFKFYFQNCVQRPKFGLSCTSKLYKTFVATHIPSDFKFSASVVSSKQS